MRTHSTDPASLRGATAADLPAITKLLEASSLPLDGVAGAIAGFMIAESHGDVVGVAGLETCRENAFLRSVAVRVDWRSRGLGRTLVTRVIAEAESRGIDGLYLLTTTADHYFPGFGFQRIDRGEIPADVRETDEFRSACPASATAMALQLPRPTRS